jgi:acetyl esterase/lipase
MVSLSHQLTETAVRFLSHKRLYRLQAAELDAYLFKVRGRQRFAPPSALCRKHEVREEFLGGRPCYVISPRGASKVQNRGVLFLHGGGLIEEAHWVHWRAASRLVSRLGLTVWFPAYPLLTSPREPIPAGTARRTEDITESIRAVYETMLPRYPGGIIFLGDSAGAALSLILCHHIKTLSLPIPMPKKLILLSPAMLTEQDPAILAEMDRLRSRDIMLSPNFMTAMIGLFNMDVSRDNYFNAPLYGDFRAFPPMHVFSGTGEIFYPQVVPFVERVRAAGVPVKFHPEKDMMHVWPYMPVSRESRAALEKIFDIIAAPW